MTSHTLTSGKCVKLTLKRKLPPHGDANGVRESMYELRTHGCSSAPETHPCSRRSSLRTTPTSALVGLNHAYEAIGRALTRRADARTVVATKRTGVTCVDDRVQFGSRPLLEAEIVAFSTDARGVLGPTAVNDAKTILSTPFDTIGWRFNTVEGTVAPSPPALLTLIYVFCVTTPRDIKAGATMKVRHLKRLRSLAIRYSRAMMPLRHSAHAFAKNTGGPDMDRNAVRHLSRPAYADLLAWRRDLELAVTDPSKFTVHAAWLALDVAPPLDRPIRGSGSTPKELEVGVYAPGIAWDGACVPDRQYFLNGGQKAAISNNVFDFFAIVSGLANVMRARKHAHVQIFTDNTSALSWATKCRGESGFLTLLIRVLCDLQVAHQECPLVVGAAKTIDSVVGDPKTNLR